MNLKYFSIIILIVSAILFGLYVFAQSILKEKADQLLDHAYVTLSPDKTVYAGFIEDCEKLSTTGNCKRLIYYYNTSNHTRGKCVLVGGYEIDTPMFQDLFIRWKDSQTLLWQSTWSKGKKISAKIDLGRCDENEILLDSFYLIPSLVGTLEKYITQEALYRKKLDDELMYEATQGIIVE